MKMQVTSIFGKNNIITSQLHYLIDKYFDHLMSWCSLGIPYVLKPNVNDINVEFKVLKVNSSKVLILRLNNRMIAKTSIP